MTRDDWHRAEPILTQALLLPERERQALIDTAQLSEALRRELEELLRRHAGTTTELSRTPGGVGLLPSMAAPSLNPGDKLDGGRFVIVRQIGRGGMGTVYLAQDTTLGTLVALKVMPSDDRLITEARRAAVCSGHAHVATVHNVLRTEFNGQPLGVLVMEYLAGTPASRLLDDGRIELGRALRWMKQVAAAVAHAHGCQVLHCDLKPANIMIGPDDQAKVLDFGISRATFDPANPAEPLRGTPPYMAPEQWSARQFTAAGDIYSLGICLFELVTGRRPFSGDEQSLRTQILFAPPPPLSQFVAGVPPALEAIVQRALAKDPDQRFRSARAFEHALEDVERALMSNPAPIPSPFAWNAVRYAQLAGAALAVLTGLGFISSRALDAGLDRAGEFRVESPLWWPVWGAMSLVAPVVGVVVPLVVALALTGAVCRSMANSAFGWRWCGPLAKTVNRVRAKSREFSPASLGQLLVIAQLATLAVALWYFFPLVTAIFNFGDPASRAPFDELRPSNGESYGVLRRLLSAQLFVFGVAWWRLIRRGIADLAVPLTAGAAVTLVTLFFFAVPFRVLNHNEYRRVTYGEETCYLTAEHRGEVLLFCPKAVPRTRIVAAEDGRLVRSDIVENIFSTFDPPAVAPEP